jgi:hypothetical protein
MQAPSQNNEDFFLTPKPDWLKTIELCFDGLKDLNLKKKFALQKFKGGNLDCVLL